MGRFRDSLTHIRRIPYQSLAAVMIMALTIFVSTVVVIAAVTSSSLLSYFETRPQITAFFKSGTDEETILRLKDILEGNEKVASVTYVSQEEAFQIYQEYNKDEPLLLELVTPEILPASLEITAVEVSYLDELRDFMQREGTVEEVVFQKDVVDTLVSWTTFLRSAGFLLISFLLLESILIILMVIAMKIAIRRGEIEIMKLLGATTWYIRSPFLFEGVLYGFVGSILAVVGVSALLVWAQSLLSSFFAGIPHVPPSPQVLIVIFLGQVIGGMLIGALGSFVAVWRYLKE